MNIKLARGAFLLLAYFGCAPLWAHHSFAVFDATKNVVLSGVIKQVQWTNPHVWVVLVVQKKGEPSEWRLEAGAPTVLSRNGWKKNTVAVGDKVEVEIHPRRDGSTGGSVVRIKYPDGRVIGGPPPGASHPGEPPPGTQKNGATASGQLPKK